MNLMDRVKLQQHINVILSAFGLIGSLYILGWVDHARHFEVGASCFILFLLLTVLSAMNYNSVVDTIKDSETKPDEKS